MRRMLPLWLLLLASLMLAANPGRSPAQGKPVCGSRERMDILVVGAYPKLYGLGDAVRIVHVDFTKPEVVVVPLPRDLYVDLPWGAAFPSPVKLTSAYLLGTPLFTRGAGDDGGVQLLKGTLAYNFGLRVDRYLVVSAAGIKSFIDAIGGVPVDIPYPIYDPATGANFQPGSYVLNSDEALKLARSRVSGGDLERIRRQNWVLKGVVRQLARPQTLTRIPAIVQALRSAYISDIQAQDLDNLLCLAAYMTARDMRPRFVSIPDGMLQGMKDYVYINRQIAVAFVFHWDQNFVRWLHEQVNQPYTWPLP